MKKVGLRESKGCKVVTWEAGAFLEFMGLRHIHLVLVALFPNFTLHVYACTLHPLPAHSHCAPSHD